MENANEETWIETDTEKKQLIASYRKSGGYYDYYKWIDANIVLTKTDEITWEAIDSDTEKLKEHHIIKENVNGKMQITDDYYKD